ncbi:hypothetical protein EGW08_015602, partial [Elysia chlorotica]
MGSLYWLAFVANFLVVPGITHGSFYEPDFGYVNDPQDLFDYEYNDYKFEEEITEKIPCPPPPKLANGETIVWGEGLLLEYRCKPEFFPVGITHGACDLSTGKWTISPPV